MESLSNGAKRKKRKTRKCLDEIRKRSRRTGQILFEKDGRSDEMYHKNIQNCLITNNRLTLRMFPKVIQSKTITRPVLLNLEHKPILNELVTGSVLYTEYTKRIRIPVSDTDNHDECFQNESYDSDSCEPENFILENEKTDQHSNDKNYEIFCSLDESSHKSPNSMGPPTPSSTTSSSPHSLHEDNRYNLYEEFMAEVPACLQHNSRLIQEDVMKKTKMLLQNLFIESCYECEDNIARSGEAGSGYCSSHSPARRSESPDSPSYAYYPHRLN